MIISLSGKAGCGKSTIAKYLSRIIECRVMHLADALREDLAARGIPRFLMDTQEGKSSRIKFDGRECTVREAMEAHSDKCATADAAWLTHRIIAAHNPTEIIIVDDLRRRAEARVLAAFGPTVRIFHYAETDSTSATECELDEWPYFDFVSAPAYGELTIAAYHIARFVAAWPQHSGIVVNSATLTFK